MQCVSYGANLHKMSIKAYFLVKKKKKMKILPAEIVTQNIKHKEHEFRGMGGVYWQVVNFTGYPHAQHQVWWINTVKTPS